MTMTTPTGTDVRQMPVVDLYRDIHKGIRAELFAITSDAGRIDPADRDDRAGLHDHIVSMAGVLESHAHHEDAVVDPVLQNCMPEQAERINQDHLRIEAWFERIAARSLDLVGVTQPQQRSAAHALYLELAAFTGTYLAHQDLEERGVMPALEVAVGPEKVGEMFGAIVGSIPPEEMARSLAFMLPAMNVLDRTEMLAGMRAGAPAAVFDQLLGLARSVLTETEFAALERGLDSGTTVGASVG